MKKTIKNPKIEYTKICTECGSTNIGFRTAGPSHGGANDFCKSCGFKAKQNFPEIKFEDIESFRKHIKTETSRKKNTKLQETKPTYNLFFTIYFIEAILIGCLFYLFLEDVDILGGIFIGVFIGAFASAGTYSIIKKRKSI